MSPDYSDFRKPYEVRLIEPTKTPVGAEGANWFYYEIAQGLNVIHGYRQGTMSSVTEFVELTLVQINDRKFGNQSKSLDIDRNKKAKK